MRTTDLDDLKGDLEVRTSGSWEVDGEKTLILNVLMSRLSLWGLVLKLSPPKTEFLCQVYD